MNNKYASPNHYSVAHQYPGGSASAYTSTGYHHSSVAPNAAEAPQGYSNADPRSMPPAYTDPAYYNNPHYPSGSPPVNQHMYSPVSPTPLNYAQAQSLRSGQHIPRPRSTVPQSAYTHSPSHSYSHPYPQTPTSPTNSAHPHMVRPRSNSQAAYDRLPPQPSGYAAPAEAYYTEVPIPQTIGISSDYPTSSVRPFACDLCALSFNRQHDLKRHRETHTGEKPFPCNGGCGKTFTRKDALKRHQLVKNCGKVDETWP